MLTEEKQSEKLGFFQVAALLLHYGADPLLKNEMGTSALDEASDPCMKRLLKHHLARSERDSVSGRKESLLNGGVPNICCTVFPYI